MKMILIPLFALFLWISLSAQSCSPSLLSTCGGHIANSSAQLSYSLGEVITATYATPGNFLTQGFHQPQLTSTALHEWPPYLLAVYPNPTSGVLHLEFSEGHDLRIKLYDLSGKLIHQKKCVQELKAELDLSLLPVGTYQLRIDAPHQSPVIISVLKK